MNKSFNSIRYAHNFQTNNIEEIRIQKIVDIIGHHKTVLDVGCGDGYIMKKIRENGNDVSGIEIATKAIIRAKKKGFEVYDLNLNTIWSAKIKKKFDVVFAGEIIEHIFNTDIFLRNIRSVLKKNGTLIITTPNIASLGRRLLLLLGKSPLLEISARSYDAGHIRYFSRESLKQLLIENRFNVKTMNSSVINFDSNGLFYSKWLALLFPTFGNNIIVEAIKQNEASFSKKI